MYIVRLHTWWVRGRRDKFGLHAARPTIYSRQRNKTEERRKKDCERIDGGAKRKYIKK